jgi:hypothetical protein
MPTGFTKSEEGVKEYSKISAPYPDASWDNEYEAFLGKTKKCPPERRTKEIRTMIRKVVDDREYIIHNEMLRAQDSLGNTLHCFRSNLGKYPIPRVKVDSYQDWRDCKDPQILHRFGHVPNQFEIERLNAEQAGKIPSPSPRQR